MGVKSKNQLKKQEVKNKRLVRDRKKELAKEINALSGSQKIQHDIAELHRKIKSCNYDLENGFKGHAGIIHKKEGYETQLKTKENELSLALKTEEEERIKREEASKNSQPLGEPITPEAADTGPQASNAVQNGGESTVSESITDESKLVALPSVNDSKIKEVGDGSNNSL